MIKKWLSFIVPITISKRKSVFSNSLEITWNNGELVLDSKNTNYSFGSLQRILRKGLKTIGYERILKMEHVLLLGVAGGSVIKTLVEEVRYNKRITGVDIDPTVIEMANQFFKLNEICNLEIVIDDAFEFVLKTNEKYDLIIIDVFQDTTMPNFLFESFFIERIVYLLKGKGVVLFNTMLLNQQDNERNVKFLQKLEKRKFKITVVPRVEQHNELILIEKV